MYKYLNERQRQQVIDKKVYDQKLMDDVVMETGLEMLSGKHNKGW